MKDEKPYIVRIIKGLIEEQRGIENVKDQDSLGNTLGYDSLSVAELEMEIENAYGISGQKSWATKDDCPATLAMKFENILKQNRAYDHGAIFMDKNRDK